MQCLGPHLEVSSTPVRDMSSIYFFSNSYLLGSIIEHLLLVDVLEFLDCIEVLQDTADRHRVWGWPTRFTSLRIL